MSFASWTKKKQEDGTLPKKSSGTVAQETASPSPSKASFSEWTKQKTGIGGTNDAYDYIEKWTFTPPEPEKFKRETNRWTSDGGGRKSTARRMEDIQADLDAANNRRKRLQMEESILLAPDAMTPNDERLGEVRTALEALAKEITALDTEKRVEELYSTPGHRDSFSGQFDANMELGRLSQDQGRAWSAYLDDPSDINRKQAELQDEAIRAFLLRNGAALDDEGVVGSWISKDLANYLPQFIDQTKAQVGGAIVGGLGAGLLTGGTGTLKGIKAGSMLASGQQMFEVTRGAAYKRFIDMGVDDELARALAQDEGIVNGIIESGDTGLDWLMLGGSKALNAILPGLAGKATTALGKTALAQLWNKIPGAVKAVGGYALNIGQEGGEEGWQEGVSIANDKRALAGENSGLWELAKASVDEALAKENRDRVLEAAKGGMKIAAMMGGAQVLGNQAVAYAAQSRNRDSAEAALRQLADEMLAEETNAQPVAEQEVKPIENQNPATQTSAGASEIVSESSFTPKAENAAEGLKMASEAIKEEQPLPSPAQDPAATVSKEAVDAPVLGNSNAFGKAGQAVYAEAVKSARLHGVSEAAARGEIVSAYISGLTGAKMPRPVSMSQNAVKAMYGAGKQDAAASLAAEQRAAQYATMYSEGGGLIYPDGDEYIGSLDKEVVNQLNLVGKALGVKIQFADHVADGQANGEILNGVITIAKDAVNPVRVVLGHEITHRMQELAPAEYRAFRDAAMALYQSQAQRDLTIASYMREYSETTERAMDEIAADVAGKMLEDGTLLDEFINRNQTNRSMLEKLRDLFRDLGRKLSGVFRNKAKQAELKLTKALQASAEQASKIGEQKNTTQKSGVSRNSSKNEVLAMDGIDWMDDYSSIKGQLEKHASALAQMEPVAVVEYTPKSKSRLSSLILNEVAKIGGKDMKNSGVTFEFEKAGVNIVLSHARSPELQAAALAAPYVAKHGKLIAGQKNHEGSGLTTLTFAAPAIINGATVNVGVVVQFQFNGRPRAVNVGLQTGGVFKLDMTKAPKGLDSRVSRYGQGTSLPTMGASGENVPQNGTGVKSRKSMKGSTKPIGLNTAMQEGAAEIGKDGNRYSLKSMRHDLIDGQMFRDLEEHCGMTSEETSKLRTDLEQLVEYMTPHRDILDLNETEGRDTRRFSPYKPNSDPLYKISLDYSTLCSKRLLTQYVIENLQLRENRPMSAEEQMAIRDLLIEYRKQDSALQVACAMCYVEAARLKSPNQMRKWMSDPTPFLTKYFAMKNKEFSAYVKSEGEKFKESKGYKKDTVKKDMKPKDRTAFNNLMDSLRKGYTPTAEEQAIIDKAVSLPNSTYLTSGNLANLSESDPVIYDAYTSFIRNATRSKALEQDIAYYYGDSTRDNGNGVVVTDSFIESVNAENGMRASSWSDWRIQHMLDWITAVIDLSVRGSSMHAYTKFPDEVRVLGKTGIMFNLSGVLQGKTGVKEDGTLDFSPTESIDHAEAMKLRDEFPETAGMQCIGVSDESIFALLRSDDIDYVIPYHTSGLNATLRRMCDIYGWKDYTGVQNASKANKVSKDACKDPANWHKEPVFSEFFVGYKTGMSGIEAMRASADRYIEMCHERDLVPKFEKFAGEPNYWKLLIDRKMINQKTGNLIEQKPVKPDFDFSKDGAIYDVINRHVENFDASREQKALDYVVQNWDSLPKRISDLKKGKKKALDTLANQTTAAEPKGARLSLKGSDRLAEEVDRIMAEAKANGTSKKDMQARIYEAVGQVWDELVTEYGSIKPGEKPARDVRVPTRSEEGKKISQSVRTAMEASATPDDFIPLMKEKAVKGGFSFVPITNDESVRSAEEYILARGWQKALTDWTSDVRKGKAGDQITAIGALLYNHAVNAEDFQTAMDIFTDYQVAVRNSARGLQAARILKTLTPESRLYMIRKDIQNMVDELDLPDIELPDELTEAYKNAKTNQEIDDAVGDIQQYVAEQIPPAQFLSLDWFNALRYMNMLGNFKTQVRNVSGNVGMRFVGEMENAIAAGLEHLAGGKVDKTRAVFVSKELRDLAKEDFANVRSQVLGEDKYTIGNETAGAFMSGVNDKRQVFGGVFTPLEYYRKATNWAMNNEYFGDEAFSKSAYVRALSEYLTANKVTAEQFKSEEWRKKNAKFLDKARSSAIQRAQELTFRDSNTLSDWIQKAGRRSDTPTAIRKISEGVMPFRRTPANVLIRAEEYSPLGIINTVVQAVRAKKGDATGTDVINSLSKTLTGTGIFVAGMLLQCLGVVRGGEDDDEKKAAYDDLTGHQTYALEIPGLPSITMDWLTPSSMPFFMGAQLEALREEGGIELKDLERAMTSIADPMLQMSMMQGLNDTLMNLRYATDANIGQLAIDAALSYLTQGITNSLVGHLARTMDDESTMTYVDRDSWIPSWIQKQIGSVSRKIPVWDYNQVEYIDAWGRTESAGSAFDNFLNPAWVSDVEESPMEQELLRLYEVTGKNVIPSRAEKSFEVNKETKYLTAEEYAQYAKKKGQTAYSLLTTITNSSEYKALNDEDKAEIVSGVYSYANAVAKMAVSNYKPQGSVNWINKAIAAEKKSRVKPETYIRLHAAISDIKGWKYADKTDKNGRPIGIEYSEDYQIMALIYEEAGLTDAQRQTLFESFGVSEKIRKANKKAVHEWLQKTKKKAK